MIFYLITGFKDPTNYISMPDDYFTGSKLGMQLINISTVNFTVVQQGTGTVFTRYGMADYVKTWIEGI
jgi:hypothetical protein